MSTDIKTVITDYNYSLITNQHVQNIKDMRDRLYSEKRMDADDMRNMAAALGYIVSEIETITNLAKQ